MTIEERLEAYIMARLAEAYPEIDPDQVIVRFPDGSVDYSGSMAKHDLCDETLQASIVVASTGALDRLRFLRAFPRKTIRLDAAGAVAADGEEIRQKYTGHRFRDNVELSGFKGTEFKIEFTRRIKEA